MATAKPQYKGGSTGELLPDFSDELKATLRGFYPDQAAKGDGVFEHPADDFVNRILAEAWWAKSELHFHDFDVTKQQLRAEQADLLKTLNAAYRKLKTLSPDFSRILSVDADVLGCADMLKEQIGHVQTAGQLIDTLPTVQRPVEKNHAVVVEMAVRVLRVLKHYEIAPAATGNAYFDYTSDAIRILKAIGDDFGLVLANLTWRGAIIDAKKLVPDL